MYIFPENIKKSYESLKVPMIIIEPLASGDFELLAISDGFLDFHSLSRDYLKRFHDKLDTEIFLERLHQDIHIPKWESEKERQAQDNNW